MATQNKLMDELNTLAVIYGRPSEMFIEQVPPYAKVPYPEATSRSTQRPPTSHTPPQPPAVPAAAPTAAPAAAPTAAPMASATVGGLLDVRSLQAQALCPSTQLIW